MRARFGHDLRSHANYEAFNYVGVQLAPWADHSLCPPFGVETWSHMYG